MQFGALLMATGLLTAACGSSGGSEADGSTKGSTAKGDPIIVQTESNLSGQSGTYPNITETAKAYEQYINAKGGINGRPLKVIICDNKGDAADGAKCARSAASNKVVAVVGSYNADPSREIPIYEEEKIAWFGVLSPGSQIENTSKVSFPFNFITGTGAAAATEMAKDGCKSVVGMYLDYPFAGPFEDAFANGWKSAGQDPAAVHNIRIPPTALDFSAQAGKASGYKPDCVWGGIMGESTWPNLITAMDGVGSSPRYYGQQGNLDGRIAKQFPEQTNDAKFFGGYPDISGPQWNDFRAALKSSNADPKLDYNTLAGLGDWSAYVAFTNIVEKMTGPINNATFLDAASKTTNLDTGGLLPPLNFSQEWTGAGGQYPRAFDRSIYVGVLKDGKVDPTQTPPIDVSNAFDGKPTS
ncbi:MAG: ABC transporter substrate-binding protein [Solirubrobacteraceae bacterium]